MILKGKVHQLLEIEKGISKSDKEWEKQTLVIDNGDQYNPYQAISFFGDKKVALLAELKKGQEVEVSINLSSKEFNGKWYSGIDGWKVDTIGDAPTPENEDEEDLPF